MPADERRGWVEARIRKFSSAPLLRPDQPHAYYPVAALDGTAEWTRSVTHLAVPPLALNWSA